MRMGTRLNHGGHGAHGGKPGEKSLALFFPVFSVLPVVKGT